MALTPTPKESADHEAALSTLARNIGTEALDALFDEMQMHLRELNPLLGERLKQSEEQTELIYAPDFQELYSYMYPYKSGESAIISSYFLTHSRRRFILLDGTIYELISHLNKVSKDIKRIERTSHTNDLVSLERYTRDLSLYNVGISRLLHWFKTSQILTSQDLFPDQDAPQYDENTYNSIKDILDLRRDKERNNQVDAINIASVIWHHNNPSDANARIVLVTHSATLLDPYIWGIARNPHTRKTSSRLFKHLFSAFYETIISNANHGDELGEINFIREAIRRCSQVVDVVASTYGLTKRGASNYPKRFSPEALNRFFEMEVSTVKWMLSEELAKLEQYFRYPILQQIDSYRAKNAQHDITIRQILGESPSSEQLENLAISTRLNKLSGIINDLLNITFQKTQSNNQLNDGSDLHLQEEISLDSVKFRELTASTGTRQFEISRSDHKLILRLERYIDGYYSIYWYTLHPLKDFVERLNRLARHIPVLKTANFTPEANSMEVDPDIRGIIIGTSRGRYTFSLEWPISTEEWFSNLEEDETLYFVRINTEIGDFFFDFPDVDSDNFSSGQVGVISHLNILAIIVSLFSHTSSSFVASIMLRFELESRLKQYPQLGDES